ncbi:hypothetical protein G8C92_26615 [Paenibacillus donghaensis]|uniref:TerB N-terminal domain-containing protein n=1 Tax=Paenibacillus donghaensis TaxID=414771 RepID=UPI00188312F5|nr:TerB N-terminal domain-containing protein [Paenibacillus donghaensis]MBE9917593.1 hypothetical protein [Paenibacillus donghaensis]
MNSYNKSLDFAEIDISGGQDQNGSSLPEMIIPERKNRPAQEGPLFAQELSKERRFVQQAKEWADREGGPAAFVPFMSYWPTYEHMSEAQRDWYFFWRSEVRKGQYPFTDLSYIFVYSYELIHGIGWEKPTEGYEWMMKLWDAYGERYPKLNSYMADWVSDFVLVHRLEIPLMDIVMRSQSAKTGELFDLELTRLFTYEPSALRLEHILTLSDYDLQRSKFYLDGGRSLLEEYVPKVVALVDSFLRKITGKNLVDTFYKGHGKKIERYLFRSAVYDAELYGRTFSLHISQLRKCPPLRYYMTQLVRCTENKLRELQHFKGRLRGVTLKKETEMLIGRFLDKEFKPQKTAGPAISIDPGRLAELQRDSEDVRNMLTVEDLKLVENGQAVEDLKLVENGQTVEDLNGQTTGDMQFVEKGRSLEDVQSAEPRGNTGQKAETRAAISPDSTKYSETVTSEVPLEVIEAQLQLEAPDHQDDHPGSEQEVVWDTSSLDEDWILFAARLGQVYLETLYALKSEDASTVLNQIAEKYGMMPALLLDEINEFAMETVGDLVIDGESIAEEYIDCFELLKR